MKLTERHKKIKEIVEKELSCSAHDIDHIMRVYSNALKIADGENKNSIDMDVLKSSALLHDIARAKEDNDSTGVICHAEESSKMSGDILRRLGYSEEKIKQIQHCIISHRYKTNVKPKSIEAKILFDADKLDSLGAICIVRAGMWMGRHDCGIFPKMSLKKYAKINLVGGKLNGRIKDPSLHNIFYEHEIKDRKLPKIMHTKIGKKIAAERLRFMDIFLERLKKEARGEI